MPNTFETGHTINVAHLGNLISRCENFGADYNPAADYLKIPALTALHNLAKEKLTDIATKQPIANHAIMEREALFSGLSALVTRLIAALTASGAPKRSIENAKTISRKLQGKRAKALPTVDTPPDANNEESTPHTISVSQMSFDSRIGNFERLIEILAAEPDYHPNEPELQIAQLQRLLSEMQTKNNEATNAIIQLDIARNARNQVFYKDTHCLFNTAKDVKEYVKSKYGAQSIQYQQVRKINFSKNSIR